MKLTIFWSANISRKKMWKVALSAVVVIGTHLNHIHNGEYSLRPIIL